MLRLRGHDAPLTQAAFSPDGARLITADQEGAVIIWDAAAVDRAAQRGLPTLARNAILLSDEEGGADLSFATLSEFAAYACRRAGRNLTPAEWQKYVGAEYRKSCADHP